MEILRCFSFASVLLCFEIFDHLTWAEKSTSNFTKLVEGAFEGMTTEAEENVMKSVLMVCSSNQCRSPLTSAVFRELVKKRGLEHKWRTDSAGIWVNCPEARWPMDQRARRILKNHKIENVTHAARPVEEKDFFEFDYMLGMDHANVEDLTKRAPPGSRAKIELLSTYDPLGSKYMRDPYPDPIEFKDETEFEDNYKLALRSLEVFLDKHE